MSTVRGPATLKYLQFSEDDSNIHFFYHLKLHSRLYAADALSLPGYFTDKLLFAVRKMRNRN